MEALFQATLAAVKEDGLMSPREWEREGEGEERCRYAQRERRGWELLPALTFVSQLTIRGLFTDY